MADEATAKAKWTVMVYMAAGDEPTSTPMR